MATAKGGTKGDFKLVLVEYTGSNHALTSWFGEGTSTRYQFSRRANRGYVKEPDVAGFLDVMENGRPVFRVMPVKVSAPVKEETMDDRHVEVTVETAAKEEEQKYSVPDVGEMTVKAVKEYVADSEIPSPVLVKMAEAERRGKNRKSVLAALNEALGV